MCLKRCLKYITKLLNGRWLYLRNIFKPVVLFVCIEIPLLLIVFGFLIFGNVNFNLQGFAVDSNGLLYLGFNSKIQVIGDGVPIRSISAKTSKGYSFTIQSNDTILLCALNKVYTLDLQGNELSVKDDYTTNIFNEIYNERETFKSNDGTIYRLKNILGYYYICSDNGDVIYKMPLLDFTIKIISIVSFISFFIFVPIIVIKWRLSNKTGVT